MKVHWSIETKDIARIKTFVKSQNGKTFVEERRKTNVETGHFPRLNKRRFWRTMIMCLLTTQQRVGPGRAVDRFCSMNPFPLSLKECSFHAGRLSPFVEKSLRKSGGLRWPKKIGKEVEYNLRWLNNRGWGQIEAIAHGLLACRMRKPRFEDVTVERKAATFVDDNLKGFGPKQSRNLWQSLGLFRFEIPIDSRITKWLNKNAFPLRLSAGALADVNYYEFVMTGIQELCRECDVLPCILDAAIFISFDSE